MAFVYVVLLVLLCCCTRPTIAEDLSSASSCEDICLSAVNRSQGVDSVGYCTRGCRLMRLVDFANDGEGNLDELLLMCLQSCSSAYDGMYTSAITGCQSGCRAQLPLVKTRRQQLALFSKEAEQYVHMLKWINSVVNCLHSSNQPDINSQPSNRGYYVRARIVVISSSDDDSIPLRSVYGQAAAVVDEPERSPGSNESWLDCMSEGSGLSRQSLMILFGVTAFMLTMLTLGVCCPGCFIVKPVFTHDKKLSIYGDGEYLKTLDDDNDEELLLDRKSSVEEPQLILMKIPIHVV